jgi:hypothetical protein
MKGDGKISYFNFPRANTMKKKADFEDNIDIMQGSCTYWEAGLMTY